MKPPSQEDVRAHKRALAANPQSLPALVQLGWALRSQGQDQEAEVYCLRALRIRPDEPDALRILGGMLQLQGRHDEALVIADAAIAVAPGCGEAWLLRGDSLLNAGRPELAADAYRRAAEDRAAEFLATLRLGKVCRVLGRQDEALAAFDRATELQPDAAQPAYERGLLRLERRDFAAGWQDYEARWRWDAFLAGSRGFVPAPLVPHLTLAPDAAALAGKRVLLIGEQGIGDQLMFASMLPDLARTAASVLCLCEPRLMRLLSGSFPDVTFMHPSGAQVDSGAIDVLLAMGSLGSAFRRSEADFPGAPFVRPGPETSSRWAAQLGPRTAPLRVGLSWRGGVPSSGRAARSIDLAQLQPILALPDCEFVSLQYGDVAAEVEAVNAGRDRPIRLFPPESLHDFEDFAGLVDNLDAVVSVQNATVHLAGALGKTCLALTPHNPEWRYMRQGPAMPWYRSVRLFRQPAPADWSSVIADAAAALTGPLAASPPSH